MKRYKTLIDLVHKYKPKTILEIGTHRAIRAEQMVRAAQQYNEVKYIGFDLFDELDEETRNLEHHGKKWPDYNLAQKILGKTGCKFELIKGDSKKTIPEWINTLSVGEIIDFIWLDGGHSLETITKDFWNINILMDNNSVLVLDDYYSNREDVGCKPLIDSLDKEYWKIKILEPHDILSDKTIHLVKVKLKPCKE